MKKLSFILTFLLLLVLGLSACGTPVRAGETKEEAQTDYLGEDSAPAAGKEESSEKKEQDEPDFDTVFPQQAVNEITISISQENWQLMMDDMTDLYGEQGNNSKFRPGGNNPPPPLDQPAVPRGGAGMMGGADDQNPVWVEAEVFFNGEIWEHVGIRFKGNSSLKFTWGSGSLKLPFKLDFDEFEDEFPETENQRFYGFKQLSFSSGFHDGSMLREKVTADIFREAGIPSAHTAFYAVTIDYGEGPIYFGLYTVVEVVDDTVIETQFSDDRGNVYKPEGAGGTFAAGTFNEDSFDKETNQDENDYSDVLSLFSKLHADTRFVDQETWRSDLESVFDVDTFLNWLAINTVVQNWDVYGAIPHNYYLYNNPETSQLVWIPWDNNESLKSTGGVGSPLELDLSGVDKKWPLINFLRDDPVYYQKYLEYLEAVIEGPFEPQKMAETYNFYHDLIAPYVIEESAGYTQLRSKVDFERSVNELIGHTRRRVQITEDFLSYIQ